MSFEVNASTKANIHRNSYEPVFGETTRLPYRNLRVSNGSGIEFRATGGVDADPCTRRPAQESKQRSPYRNVVVRAPKIAHAHRRATPTCEMNQTIIQVVVLVRKRKTGCKIQEVNTDE